MLQRLIIHFLLQVKNKINFHTFSSKSGRGRLQEVPNIVV